MFITMFFELGFKLSCFTPSQLFQSYFLLMEVSIGQKFHFSVHSNTLHYKTRFLFSSYQGSPKQPFIVKTWSSSKNKLHLNLQLKTDSVKDFITDISSKVLKIYSKRTQLHLTFPIKYLVRPEALPITDSGTDSPLSLPFIVKLSCL